jgi:hypothetical protein
VKAEPNDGEEENDLEIDIMKQENFVNFDTLLVKTCRKKISKSL